ncbi:MAG TPA: hypothetical protein VFK58_05940 [Sphingomicrobium sp.]|nr:hypothetical protein [Sphingomicrobium sp.]
MRTLGFALLAGASLALAACGGNDTDTLNEAAAGNEAELNALAANAAADANAELEALGSQQEQLEAEANSATETADEVADNATDPSEVEDNVQGM